MGVTGDGRQRPTSAQRLEAVLLQPPFLRTSHPPQSRRKTMQETQPAPASRIIGERQRTEVLGLLSYLRVCLRAPVLRHISYSIRTQAKRGKHDAVGGRTKMVL
ncbi:hypothetical protein H112_03836 [Trichophyton rubrum D6]|uniref:Uncharacterized protein n=2 Tax=Trichophyton TaxID=5550 RepID=A0A022W4W5_TRIRU|nr:hypothetical protein H100_03845 [Trichophyton rubrum MR850]EZF42544.1 hypothetical protein H102_03832 [Trichophyton rubrum CBS 100081]EZF53161.1 hypothetical protein H103_03847 [Trichophyton rubrum CBS 288.86]EZF63829.1 hypothetical protein H104_03831 [Trichophyton rubrum CBS 289.86]EZF74149.1 hypothetical protein H105_03860 [Trichophyton soudanense CBS 452.61]EZF85108.1 hypothetical protein H110_03838 [Trichophyton rubrum MR1448]EZF95946.1 hypothetical protein H113_03869 [Trichophyton rub